MSIRILVVDDNPDILANVRDFLSMKDGWAPETASTGLEALERIDRSPFDLVIRDVGLPATDYLIKPFSLRELAARVEALLRRSGANPAGRLTAGPLSLDLKTLRVEREGRDIKLNPTCLQLLRELMQQSPGIVSRRRLEAVLWQGEPPASDSLRSNLYLLRQAVDKPFDRPLIHTHPGLGWYVADLPDSVS